VQSELAIKIYGEDQKVMTQISKDIQKALEGLDGLEEIEIEPPNSGVIVSLDEVIMQKHR
jgi:Cu/Ag efflux pump CusA